MSNLEQIPVLTATAVFFILGILMMSFISIPFFVLLAFCLIMLIFTFLKRKKNFVFVLSLLFLCLGLGGLHLKNHLRPPRNHIALLALQKAGNIQLGGIIDSDPVYPALARKGGAYGARKINFVFKIKKIISNGKSYEAQGKVLANIYSMGRFTPFETAGQPEKGKRFRTGFTYGDKLILEGRLYRPFNFASGSNFSYRDYLYNQGISYVLSAKKENKILFLAGKEGNFFKSLAFRLKHKFEALFKQELWPINSDVLSAIILGERQNFPEDIKRTFIQTGTAHIIAISGFNVGIVVFIILIFLKAIGIKRKARYLVTIPILVIHMLAVGAGASVVRATVMALIVLIAYLIGREPHIINSLSLAALIILGYNPLQIFDIGFQLSFVSVLGIVSLSPVILNLFKINSALSLAKESPLVIKGGVKQKLNILLRVILNSFSVSLAAWLATFGFVAYYFRIISPVTILANLIIVPLTSLSIVLSFTLGLSAVACPALSPSIAATTNFVLLFLFKAAYGLSRLPFAYFYF